MQRFINAAGRKEIVFVRGTTEAINLVAQSYGRSRFKAGDEILLTEMEHHSNIVPWQLLCEQTGAVLRVAPIDDAGELRMGEFEKLLDPRTKLVAAAHVSNALGTINPIRRMIELAHAAELRWWWMAPRQPRISAWTCVRSTAISMPFPGTSCTARPASACSTERPRCWTRCRLIRAAAT